MSGLEPVYTPNDVFWANLAFGLSLGLGIAFGLVSIAFAIWFGYVGRLRDFLRDSKRGQVDEKIAVIIGHTLRYREMSAQDTHIQIRDLFLRRLTSDIRAIGRIRDSIGTSQRDDLDRAIHDLLTTMRSSGFNDDADEVDRVYRLWVG